MVNAQLWKNSILALGAAIATLAVGELIFGFVGDRVLGQGRLFVFDSALGWKAQSGLNQIRKTPDGTQWAVRINEDGFRGRANFDISAKKRVLVLGDSFAFGDGVDIADRFDTHLARMHPTWSIVNRGMPGYGTDQELISARPLMSLMRSRDAVVLLTYANDFYDILRHTFVGRSKPWFSRDGGELSEHRPSASFLYVLRDYSYLVSRLLTVLERPPQSYTRIEIENAVTIYESLVRQEITPYQERGVMVLIVRHGFQDGFFDSAGMNAEDVESMFERLCREQRVSCINLDDTIQAQSQTKETLFLADGHWSAAGHRVVADIVKRHFDVIFSPKKK